VILDTNALSAMADGDSGVGLVLQRAGEVAIPVIVLGEYRYGIRQSRHASRYQRWLAEVVPACRVLPVSDDTANEYALVREELKKSGRPIPSNDVWIAALVRQHRMPLLSRDGHFDFVKGLNRVGW
jgi:predicted nucleic acid-binding protein